MAFATNILSSAVTGRRSLKLRPEEGGTTAALRRRDADGRSGVEVVESTPGDAVLRPVLGVGVVLEGAWGEADPSVARSGSRSVFCSSDERKIQ